MLRVLVVEDMVIIRNGIVALLKKKYNFDVLVASNGLEAIDILNEFTNLIEPLSIDEGFLDVSHSEKDSLEIAKDIKKRVLETTGLTMSIGISYNKFLAKIGSDWNKPDGIKVINKSMVPEILLPLSVGEVHGIGPKSAKRLNNIGIYKIRDLMNLSEEFLVSFFGNHGTEIYERIRGN